ncbi:hypothetical protein [Bdellovibrio bacteriovorus]|uniref:hypothetical protein n=1 Tax=Bdellovibrio bacteriovorus TaxID=959 RepID=UPI003AA80276
MNQVRKAQALLNKTGWTKVKLAKVSGVSHSVVHNFFSGKSKVAAGVPEKIISTMEAVLK